MIIRVVFKEVGESPTLCRNCDLILRGSQKTNNLIIPEQEMRTEQNPAFYTGYYDGLPEKQKRRRMAEDLGRYFLEAGALPSGVTIWRTKVDKASNRVVYVDPGYEGKDMREMFSDHRPTIEMVDFLLALNPEEPAVVINISPPDDKQEWPTGRINVAFSQTGEDGIRYNTHPSIVVTDWTLDKYLNLARNLMTLSGLQEEAAGIRTAEDLRERAICFHLQESQDPLNFAKDNTPLPKVWQAMENGQAQLENDQIVQASRKVIDRRLSSNPRPLTRRGDIRFGAMLEMDMVALGYNLARPDDCGPSNIKLNRLMRPVVVRKFLVESSGKITNLGGEYLHPCVNCGECGKPKHEVRPYCIKTTPLM